jgi:nickel/cobalt transporter (NicO) family protein
VAVGLQFRATVEHAQNVVVGGVLFLTGVGFAAFELCGRGHSHDHAHHAEDAPAHDGHGEHAHGHGHAEPDRGRLHGLAAIMVPFGAAASPDLTILPVFLAATTAGAGAAVGSLLAFAVVTIATVMGLTLAAAFGGYRVRGQWLERWGNAITAGVLLVIGALVLVGAL